MSTTRQLWLGFGALTVVLVLSGLVTLFRVQSIERTLKEQADVARPRSVATRELRASVTGFCLDVRAFAQNGDPQFRALAEAEANDVLRHLAEYERFATTARHRELASRFAALWRPCEALGRSILVSPVRPLRAEDAQQLGERRLALQDFLTGEMQADAVAAYEVMGDANLQHVRTIVSLALVLLIAGLAIAIATSVTVGRSIVRSERAIAEQSERLRTTLASIGDAVITTDTAGRITNLNGVAAALTGWSNETAIGQPLEAVFRIVNENTRQPVENPAEKALREGVVIGLANHTVLIARDGSERSIDDSAAPIRCKAGEVVGCVLIFRDISEQRRAARAIAASEARKHAILDTALDCIVTIDHQGRILEFNQAAERTFGHRLAGVRGRELAEVMVPPSLRDAHRQGLARYLATGASTLLDRRIELTGLRADGSEFPVELAITAIPGEGQPVFTGYLRDITERKQAELAAADRIRCATLDAEIGFALAGKDTLQAMLQACAESLMRNLDGAFVRIWTLAERDVLALQASAGLSGIDSRFDARYDRVPVGDGAIGLIAASRKPHLTNDVAGDPLVPEAEWARREGMLAFAGHPLIVNDRLVGALALFARHRLGESAHAAIASASRGIALGIERKEMEDRLRQFVAQLSEADRRKDEFLATLAHELRNPMAPIRNGLQLMRLAGAKPAAVEQARAMMERQLTQLVRLVDDLMDVSRITRGRLELRKEHVLLTTVVHSAIEGSQALIEERGHELTVSLPSQPIMLDADPTRLTQVLLNLLGNAAKYSDPGGHIWLTAERHGRELMLSVRDAGIGIAGQHLPHIFDLFAQVDRSLERSQSGLGIGLTLVKRLVEMHGGRVEAKSEGPGKGSEFVARLPIVVLSPGKPAATGADAAHPTSSLRILVVDDNCDGADSLAMMLRLVGNDVRTAYDGEQGVAEAELFRPDVVLLDIGLPKLNGYEACRRIRDQPWGQSLVAVAVTGWGQERDIRRSREAGFDHHMVKPVDPAALLQLLAELQVERTEPPPAS